VGEGERLSVDCVDARRDCARRRRGGSTVGEGEWLLMVFAAYMRIGCGSRPPGGATVGEEERLSMGFKYMLMGCARRLP
jgi:hypothetical protein